MSEKMIYRKFGNTGKKISSLGFGAMRLPMIEANGKKSVDDEKAVPLLQKAFDRGVNLVDTAPGYLEELSEITVGKALKGYRDKVFLSTKAPIDEHASYDKLLFDLETSLQKLDTDYIDFYHMWALNLKKFNQYLEVPHGPIQAARKMMDEGVIKHLSFSFHDDPENMIPIIDSGYFETVLLQYNLLDRKNEMCIDYAYEKGLGIMVMGPVGGGRLGAPSATIENMLDQKIHSTAEMALRFVLSNPKVTLALSGMQNESMLTENLKIAAIEGPLTSAEKEIVGKMLEETKRLSDLYCTGCEYCMPCPEQVNIPKIFELMNYHRIYGLTDYAKEAYQKINTDTFKDASYCIACGLCEAACPQYIEVIRQLTETHEVLKA